MLAPGEIQPDPISLADGYDSAGEHSRPFCGNVHIARRTPIQGQHTHGSIVVVHHAALGCPSDQLIARRLDLSGGFLDDLALCCHWQRDAQVLLQSFESIPGKPAAIAQQGDHARRRLIIFFFARFGRRGSRKHIPAEVAPQLLQLVHRRGNRRLPFNPHQHTRLALRINLTAALLIGTRIARLQRSVRDLDFARAPIRCGAVAPMPRSLTLRGVLPWRSVLLAVSLDAGLLQHLSGLFRAGVAQQPA